MNNMDDSKMKVTLISTVYNEEEMIADFLEAIFLQTLKLDEIIIVDAGSTDNTCSIITKYSDKMPIKLIVKNNVNRSKGRNIAIKNASYEIIASLDVGVKPEHDWLEKIMDHFDDSVDVISPWTEFYSKSSFEICVAELTKISKLDFNEKMHIPPARNLAFRKSVFEQIGGFPENIEICEDTVFGLQIKKEKFNVKCVYDAVAHWHIRKNITGLFRQYTSYAKFYALLGFINSKLLIKRLIKIFSPSILKSGVKCYHINKSIKYFIFGIAIEFCLRLAWLVGSIIGFIKNEDIKLDEELLSIALNGE